MKNNKGISLILIILIMLILIIGGFLLYEVWNEDIFGWREEIGSLFSNEDQLNEEENGGKIVITNNFEEEIENITFSEPITDNSNLRK